MEMDRFSASRELHSLVTLAAPVLSDDRLALIAGCRSCSVSTWRRRPVSHVQVVTVEEYLPRLRDWQRWVGPYQVEQAEIERLVSQPGPETEELAAELAARLQVALGTYELAQISAGCEVAESRLHRWRSGDCPEKHRAELIRALGHLRHMNSWPLPEEGEGRAVRRERELACV